MLCAASAAVARGQTAATADHPRHASVQRGSGEGDRGESAEIDEAADAVPQAGPYRSPYSLALRVPSGWNYNWAFGIHLNTDIHMQAERTIAGSAHGELRAHVILRPQGKPGEWYDGLVHELRPGDLLYIANNKQTHVTHVIMWVGDLAKSPDGVPLVIDSTGGRIKDSSGHAIPCGIHLRPFRKGSWYHSSVDHAHRWIH